MELGIEIKVAVTMFRAPGYSATNSSTSSLTLSDSQPLSELITEYQLVRQVDESPHHNYSRAFECIQPFLRTHNIDDWSFYKIVKEGTSEVLVLYATNIVEQAYHILDLQLQYPDKTRNTEMRLHELIRSTWAKDVESTGVELKKIGFFDIKDIAAREAISHQYTSSISQGMDPLSTKVTVSGNGVLPTYWRDNPLLVAACGIFGSPKNVTAHLIREEPAVDSAMHLVVELDAGREERDTAQPRRVTDAFSNVRESDTMTESSSYWC